MIFNTIVGNSGNSSDDIDRYATGVVVGENAPYIAERAFAGTYPGRMIKASFPKASYVEKYAFLNRGEMKEIDLPEVETIDSFAFGSCTRLECISAPKLKSVSSYILNYTATSTGTSLTSMHILAFDFPNLEYAESYAFLANYNSPIVRINVPNLSSGGNYIFSTLGDPGLEYFNMGPISGQWTVPGLLSQRTTLKYFRGPFFPYSCFSDFALLEECYVLLESYMTSSAFMYCSNLVTVSLPSMTSDIRNNAFTNCTKLENVYIPFATTLGALAFGSCNMLKSLHFENLSYITVSAFQGGCSQLSIFDLIDNYRIPALGGSGVFSSTPIGNSSYLGYFGSIYVPSSLYASYITSTYWSAYSARMVSV